jgi:hypothetical protein
LLSIGDCPDHVTYGTYEGGDIGRKREERRRMRLGSWKTMGWGGNEMGMGNGGRKSKR